jgi:uncharacterized protein
MNSHTVLDDDNRSANPSIHEVSDPDRRTVLRGSGLAALAGLLAPWMSAGCAHSPAAAPLSRVPLGFKGVPPGRTDALQVAEGYTATVLAPWGEPVGLPGQMPAWREDASNSAADQSAQMGMHHDGMQFYPLGGSSTHGLLVMNHEYVDDGLLHTDGLDNWSALKVQKSQAAHGLTVIEVVLKDSRWQVVRPSRYARRVTAQTPFDVGGPAAGHPLMRTASDPQGRRILGTINNCASGMTPWGTYLSGEENFNGYFVTGSTPDPHHRRWGLRTNSWYRWHLHDERFDAVKHPNGPNRFG